jgi:hypothetical protein
MLPFKLLLFRRGRTEESCGPPLFEPSLKVEGISAISKPQDFAPIDNASPRTNWTIELNQKIGAGLRSRALPTGGFLGL